MGGLVITMKKMGNQIMGKRRFIDRLRMSLILCCYFWINTAFAQEQHSDPDAAQANAAQSAQANTTLKTVRRPASTEPHFTPNAAITRDPFAMTPELANAGAAPQTHLRFTPAPALDVKLPRMSLKGMIRGQEGDVAALLDIAGNGVHMVRVNDTISLHGIGRDVVVQVKAIDHLSLVIEVGSLGQVIIVR